MKKYLLSLALVAAAASPALAATHHRAYSDDTAKAAFAMQPDAVVIDGRYVGTDPDATIRADLVRQGDPTLVNGQ